MPDIAAARKSLLVGGVMTGATGLVFFLCGSAIFAYYHQQSEVVVDVRAVGQEISLYEQLQGTPTQPNRHRQRSPR